MIKWFKQLFHIIKHFDDIVESIEKLSHDQRRLEYHVNDAVLTIKDRTTLHADVSYSRRGKHMNQLIMIGRYHNRDYIETFEVMPDNFEGLVRQCKDMQQYAYLSKVDAPISIKEIIETDSKQHWGMP